jgi:hypothetical protein
VAWITGALVFHLASPIGGTLPSVIATMVVYVVWRRSAYRT